MDLVLDCRELTWRNFRSSIRATSVMLSLLIRMATPIVLKALGTMAAAFILLGFGLMPLVALMIRSPSEPIEFEVPGAKTALLPSEKKYARKTPGAARPGEELAKERKAEYELSSLATFRSSDFSLSKALDEYHSSPIAYSIGLEEIEREVREVVRHKAVVRYEYMVSRDTFKRKKAKLEADIQRHRFRFVNLWRLFVLYVYHRQFPWQREMAGVVAAASGSNGPVDWINEFVTFKHNVKVLCRNAGVISKSTLPKRLVNDLFRYSSNRNQTISPLLKEIALLSEEVSSLKRGSAALQVRRTIERLVLELPQSFCTDPSPSVRWPKLWGYIWSNAEGDPKNPFYDTWHTQKGERTRQDYQSIGSRLYKNMSSQIHNYKEFNPEHFDCFDSFTKEIATIFSPQSFNETTQQPNWKKEIRRYYREKTDEGEEESDDDGSIGIGGLEELCKEIDSVDRNESDDVEKKKDLAAEDL